MTPRAIASRLLENDEDFDVHGEIKRMTTSKHPDYEIESEGGSWNVYKNRGGSALPINFVGEIRYDGMEDMPRERMTPEQIEHWDKHRWFSSAGWRDEDHKICTSFEEAFQWIVDRNNAKTATVRESENVDDPAPYLKPDQFTKQPSEEKIESQLRVKLRPYYPDVRISKRPGMFHGRTGATVNISDNYIWTIHCHRDTQLPLPKGYSAYHGSLVHTGVDWRNQVAQWFRDWAQESGLFIRNFEIFGRLRKDPTFQFETTRIGKLKENEDDLSPEQFLAHHVDMQEIDKEIVEALHKWHPYGISYNAIVGPRGAFVLATLYFPPEKDDFYKRYTEFVLNWFKERKAFPVTKHKLTGGPHYPHDSNYPRWGLTLSVNSEWPEGSPPYTPPAEVGNAGQVSTG